jgi:hypothetical protein
MTPDEDPPPSEPWGAVLAAVLWLLYCALVASGVLDAR